MIASAVERKLMIQEEAEAQLLPLRAIPIQPRSRNMLERIELAAIDVILEQGRDFFTTSQIANRAGCSVGAVYRLFEDRTAILDWVYPSRKEGLGEVRPGVGVQPDAMSAG